MATVEVQDSPAVPIQLPKDHPKVVIEGLPEDWDVNNSEAVMSNDPAKIYKEWNMMRSKCPVAHVDRHNGYWMLTKYDDIKNCAQDGTTFISSVCAVIPADPRGIRRPPLKFDGAEHTPYRRALDRTLKASRIKRLEVVLRERAGMLMQPLIDRGEGDICTEYGALFSAWVEKEWLNLSDEDGQMLAETVFPFVQSWRTGDWDSVKKASDRFYVIARNVMAARREQPLDPEEDPASSLLLERDAEGNPLDEYHLIGAVRQALIVAMVAPSILQAAMAKHLSEDKALQAQLRENPDLIPAAIEEFVRMYTPYRGFSRTATHEVEISGQAVPPGEPIAMTYAAANRDPDQFPEPEKFVLDRENITSHLGFGKGRHRCAGMPLARMMMRVTVEELLARTSDFDIAGEPEYARLPEIGMIGLPLKFVK